MNSSPKASAKRLNQNMPLRRFIAVAEKDLAVAKGNKGGVVICEGIPRSVKMEACLGFFPQSPAGLGPLSAIFISDADIYMVASCLPFTARARMFWNAVGRSAARGVATSAVYDGLDYAVEDGSPHES